MMLNRVRTIIGVLPAGFDFFGQQIIRGAAVPDEGAGGQWVGATPSSGGSLGVTVRGRAGPTGLAPGWRRRSPAP
jgi:hypothetical protein